MKNRFFTALIALMACSAVAQAQMADILPQHYFKKTVPKGNYSGLARISGNRYAVVNDSPAADGFDIFAIDIDRMTGEITDVRRLSTLTSGLAGRRDGEGIAYFPPNKSVFISGERDNKILEYSMDGLLTGRSLQLPSEFDTPLGNYGLESLTYNATTHRFWTTTESTLPGDGQQANATNGIANHLRLMAFDDNLRQVATLRYVMDVPLSTTPAHTYAMGVSALCALDDGRLLVLEREAYVPGLRSGSWVVNKVYSVNTNDTSSPVTKHLVAMWRTRMNLLHMDFANYEGMCAGPRLLDGRQVIVLCADSQNQYGGLLRDWFRTIVL